MLCGVMALSDLAAFGEETLTAIMLLLALGASTFGFWVCRHCLPVPGKTTSDPIFLQLNTPGGTVFSQCSLYLRLRAQPSSTSVPVSESDCPSGPV